MATEDTRPAGIGIDLSGIDIDAAIFEATGGGYGTPQGGDADGSLLGLPVNPDIWVTNTGQPGLPADPSDGFDPSLLGDPDATIRYTTDPVMPDNPLLDLMKQEETPHFANGGAEGVGFQDARLQVVVYLAAAAIAGAAWEGLKSLAGMKDPVAPEETPKDPKELEVWEETHNPDGSKKTKYEDADAAQGGPVDDSLVLKNLLTDLLGTEDFASLGKDPQAFGAAVQHIVDGLIGGKLGALGDLIAKLEDGGLDVPGFVPGADGLVIAAPGGILDFMPFGMDLDAMAVMLDPVLSEVIAEAQQEPLLFSSHDPWW